MIKKVVSLVVLCCLITISHAQEFQVPKNYKLSVAEDYDTYAQDVIKATNWLIETPINEQKAKRVEVQKFLFMWLEGSPKITLSVKQDIVTFMESPEAFIIYLGGWASYCIENNDYKNDLQGNVRGIENVITFYNANKKELGKIKAIERYKKLLKKGKLKSHLESKL